MKNNIETFEKELNSIIEICDERIKHYKALLEEYQVNILYGQSSLWCKRTEVMEW